MYSTYPKPNPRVNRFASSHGNRLSHVTAVYEHMATVNRIQTNIITILFVRIVY